MASADFISGYQSGWSDCLNKQTNQYPVAPPVPPADPAIIVIQPTQVINTIIDSKTALSPAKQQKFALIPGKTYNLAGNWSPKFGNFDLDCTGATVIVTEPANCSSGIRTTQPNCTFRNGTWSFLTAGQYDLFRFQAPLCSAIGVTLTGPTIATFGMADVGGTHALFQNCIIPITNSVSIYLTEDDAQAIGNTLAGSYGETVLRVDNPAPVKTPRNPNRVLVTGNTFHTVGGTNQKGAVEWRNAGTGCVFQNNTMYDYARVGQDGMTTAGQSIGGIQVLGNKFIGNGPLLVNLMLKNGVILIGVASNTFSVIHPITMSGPAQVTFNPATTAAAALYNKANVTANVAITGGF